MNSEVGLVVVGLSGFELMKMWDSHAPSLKKVRASGGDISVAQQLLDAEFLVGGMAVILGVSTSYMVKSYTPLVLMLAVFGAAAFWWHQVLDAESR